MRRSIPDHYATIKEALEMYKQGVDEIEATYIQRKDTIHKKFLQDKAEGKYTEEYLQKEYAEKKPQTKDLTAQIEALRGKVKGVVDAEIGAIKGVLARYFEAPVNPTFTSTLQALKTLGEKPSLTEIDILKKSAEGCYMAEKLLQAYAKGLTSTETRVVMENGEPKQVTVEVPTPVLVAIPNIDACYSAVTQLEQTTSNALNKYVGNGELLEVLFPDVTDNISQAVLVANGGGFYNGATQELITRQLAEVEGIADRLGEAEPTYKAKEKLTDADIQYIDSIVDSKYPSLANGTIKSIAEYGDNTLISLLLADSRYSGAMTEALGL